MISLNFDLIPNQELELVRDVVTNLVRDHGFDPESLMLVGARCRDLLFTAMQSDIVVSVTRDVDVAIAVRSHEQYANLVKPLRPVGSTGLRFTLDDSMPVDLIPFGRIEEPPGSVKRGRRERDSINVQFYEDVFRDAHRFDFDQGISVKMPSVEGYVLLKLRAYMDRVEAKEYKDLRDILAVFSSVIDMDVDVDDYLGENIPNDDYSLINLFVLAQGIVELANTHFFHTLMSVLPRQFDEATLIHARQWFEQVEVREHSENWEFFIASVDHWRSHITR